MPILPTPSLNGSGRHNEIANTYEEQLNRIGRGTGPQRAARDLVPQQADRQRVTQRTQKTQRTQSTQNITTGRGVENLKGVRNTTSSHSRGSVSSVSPSAFGTPQIDRAIQSTQPNSIADYRKSLFRFTRELKAIPELSEADPRILSSLVEGWLLRATEILGDDFPLDEVRIDFLRAWPKVRHAAGDGPLDRLFAGAKSRRVPEVGMKYRQPSLRLLVSLRFELQAHTGDNSWPLSCRQAGRLLNVSHKTAADWLFLLVQDEVLELVSVGKQISLKASEYRVKFSR
jgi:hypothetical protein